MGALKSLFDTLARDPRRVAGAVAKRVHQLGARSNAIHALRSRMRPRQDVFAKVYASEAWGSAESGSGTGSELRATGDMRVSLPDLLSRLEAASLLDAPCGDWNWMQHVELPIEQYHGVDIVPGVIEANQARFGDERRHFSVADLTSDLLPQVDVILCRDCLVHVSFQDAGLILENFRRTGATWLLVNTYPEVEHNRNQFTGERWRRLDFTLAPFNFPAPIETLPDGGDVDPSHLGLRRLQDLPHVR